MNTLKELDTFIELITDLAFFKNLKGQYTHCNTAFLKLHKITREELINKTDLELFSNQHATAFKENDAEVLASNKTKSYEEVLKRDNTSDSYYHMTKQIIYDSEGNKLGLFCVARDITLEKQSEFIYQDNKTLLEYIATHSNLNDTLDKIITLAEQRSRDSKCSILLLDITGTKLLSGSAPSLPNFYNEAINGIQIGPKIGSCGSAMYKQERVIVENIDTHENWQPYLELTNKANLHACWSEPIITSNNKIVGSFAIYNDKPKSPNDFDLKLINSYANLASIAIEKDNQDKVIQSRDEQLRQQSRLVQMGEMVSMIAHQWRQPLAAIAATSMDIQTKLVLETFDLDKDETRQKFISYLNSSLEQTHNLVQHLTTTITDFRDFYKPNKNSVTTTLDKVILKSLNIIKGLLDSNNIEIVYTNNSNEVIELYMNEIMQVILSILKNAQEHLQENVIENRKIKISTQGNSITICDNAGGIDKDILPKIFDPYFSTKNSVQGTGLGLYMSRTIVEKHHHGNLIVQNRDNGACFIIKINSITSPIKN